MPLRLLVNGRSHRGRLGVRRLYDGRMLSVISLLLSQPDPTDDEIVRALAGDFWRCGTFAKSAAPSVAISVGRMRTVSIAVAPECGRASNPTLAESRPHGGTGCTVAMEGPFERGQIDTQEYLLHGWWAP